MRVLLAVALCSWLSTVPATAEVVAVAERASGLFIMDPYAAYRDGDTGGAEVIEILRSPAEFYHGKARRVAYRYEADCLTHSFRIVQSQYLSDTGQVLDTHTTQPGWAAADAGSMAYAIVRVACGTATIPPAATKFADVLSAQRAYYAKLQGSAGH